MGMSHFKLSELSAIGYVVGLEGEKIRINLHEGLQGRLASHRDGVSSVTQPGERIFLERKAHSFKELKPSEITVLLHARTPLMACLLRHAELGLHNYL
jgi:hypothetical protein